MSGWKAKRFWTGAEALRGAEGWEVRLDGRPLQTPGKVPLILPTRPLAEAVAAEWHSVEGIVDPARMPLTRAANAALDKVAPRRAEVAAMLAAYGETDLLCHRAEGPAGLAARQAEAWDPLLAWAAEALEAPLDVTTGLLPVPQPAASLERLRGRIDALDPFQLTAFHDLVTLTGSLLLGFAAISGKGTADSLWKASRIDEDWQAETWGADPEAVLAAAAKRADFMQALRFLALLAPAG